MMKYFIDVVKPMIVNPFKKSCTGQEHQAIRFRCRQILPILHMLSAAAQVTFGTLKQIVPPPLPIRILQRPETFGATQTCVVVPVGASNLPNPVQS